MPYSLSVYSVGKLAVFRSCSYDDTLSQQTERNALSWLHSSFLVSEARQKCQTVWQYVRWGIMANFTMYNFADVGIRLRNLKRKPVWHEAFLQTLIIWLEYVSWSSNVTPKRVISDFWSILMCKSFWHLILTWYFEKFPCRRLLLYHSEILLPSLVKILSASLLDFATENSWCSSA